MMGNPAKKQDPKKAYGVAQYTEKMTLAKFSEHISMPSRAHTTTTTRSAFST